MLLIQAASAGDPDMLQDFCVADTSSGLAPLMNGFPCKARSLVTSQDFVFTTFREAANYTVTNTGAIATFATVAEYPAVNTQGISHVRLDFGVGGVIPLHTHPLASETIFVVNGTIFTGFVSFDNVLYSQTLQAGDLFLLPKGLLHFQINVGDGPAVSFNTLTSQNPGIPFTANQMFETQIPSAVLQMSLGIGTQQIQSIQDAIPRYYG
ncbi:unnamed protein product [Sphagnum troendelagicum]|uniref:Germin-like protein n=1 Tax=Sphagnum troendelagicum TaxID=128251 RepID=A0ABP0V4T5_9BRYO